MAMSRKNAMKLTALAFVLSLSVGVVTTKAVVNATAQTETAAFEMVSGASVRTDAPTGIRFATTVNDAYKATLSEDYDYVWGTKLTFTKAGNQTYTTYVDTQVWTDTTQTRWNTVLLGVPEGDYLTEITAESYVKGYAKDDAEKANVLFSDVVGNAQTRSIAWAASWALNDGETSEVLSDYVAAITDEVTLSASTLALTVDETQTLTATTDKNYGVVWASTNDEVVTVDKTGRVVAVGAGEATVTATLGTQVKSCAVTVSEEVFALVNDRVEIENQADVKLLETKNTYGDGTVKPVVSLDTQVKKFGDASVKVVNPANSAFTSANSVSTVKVKFDEVQDFTTKKFTQVWVYSAEDCPFVMDVQFTAQKLNYNDGSVANGTIVVSNQRQINPGWNVIEINNGLNRTMSSGKCFKSEITEFTFTVWGHKTETCTYYIDDIVLSNESEQAKIAAASSAGDVYEIISFAKTKYWEGESGQNLMLPYTMLYDDNTAANRKTIRVLNDEGGLHCTPEYAGRYVDFIGFNNIVDGYSKIEVEIENPNDATIKMNLYLRHFKGPNLNTGSNPGESFRHTNLEIAAGATGVLTKDLTNNAFTTSTGKDISNLIMINVNDVDGSPYIIKSIKFVK